MERRRIGSSFRWEPHRRNSYNGHNLGGRHGPSNAIKRAALREHSLLDIFFFIFPESVFEQIREWTDVYAYFQPVKAVKLNNRDGNVSRKIRLYHVQNEMQVQQHAPKTNIVNMKLL